MNPKQQREAEILTRLEAGALDSGSAAMLLGADSAHSGHRIRVEGEQRFRLKASIHSDPSRSPVPLHGGHLIHGSLVDGRSEATLVPHYGSTWLPWVKGEDLFLMEPPFKEIR